MDFFINNIILCDFSKSCPKRCYPLTTGYTQLRRGFVLNETQHIFEILHAGETRLHAGGSRLHAGETRLHEVRAAAVTRGETLNHKFILFVLSFMSLNVIHTLEIIA